MIRQLRAVYSGRLWCETNWWYYETGEQNSVEQKLNVAWFSALDCIAVSVFWEVANATNPSVLTLVSNWHNFRGVKETGAQQKPWLGEDVVENLKNLSLAFSARVFVVLLMKRRCARMKALQ